MAVYMHNCARWNRTNPFEFAHHKLKMAEHQFSSAYLSSINENGIVDGPFGNTSP